MSENNRPIIIDKKNTYIEKSVKFGRNVIVHPNNYIKGKTIIGDNTTILPNNVIEECNIGTGCVIEYSHIVKSKIGDCTVVGPYSRIRPNSNIGSNCKIGNFVEIKNSTLGDGTKASHLSYIGDAQIGKNCNIGCGVIFANYNGKTKNKIIVGDNCFIGSNSNLIAPLTIADNCYICAGTTLTHDTNEYDFVIGRSKEVIKPERAKNYLKGE